MKELLFCNKCGEVRYTELEKLGNECGVCCEGKYIGTGINYTKVDTEINEEYKQLAYILFANSICPLVKLSTLSKTM